MSKFTLRKYKVADSAETEGQSERHVQGEQVRAKW